MAMQLPLTNAGWIVRPILTSRRSMVLYTLHNLMELSSVLIRIFYVGILTAGENPGNFEQRFRPRLPPADYNVIWLDQDTAMEYDCNTKASGTEEYCVHFMSRTTTIEPSKLEEMKIFAGLIEIFLQFAMRKTLVFI